MESLRPEREERAATGFAPSQRKAANESQVNMAVTGQRQINFAQLEEIVRAQEPQKAPKVPQRDAPAKVQLKTKAPVAPTR